MAVTPVKKNNCFLKHLGRKKLKLIYAVSCMHSAIHLYRNLCTFHFILYFYFIVYQG